MAAPNCWGGYGITVNAVLPSIIDTAANRASMPKADFTKWVTPKELADVILFLASDESSFSTGAEFVVWAFLAALVTVVALYVFDEPLPVLAEIRRVLAQMLVDQRADREVVGTRRQRRSPHVGLLEATHERQHQHDVVQAHVLTDPAHRPGERYRCLRPL